MENPLFYYAIAALAIVVAAVLVSSRRRSRPSEQRENPYIEGLKDLVDHDREGAFQKLQQAVRSGRAPTDAYIRLGGMLRERGDAAKALQIHQSLTVKTNLSREEKVELFLNLAEDYARLGNSRKAVNVLESAVRNLHIREPQVYVTLAHHHHLLGETERAYETLREARKLGGIGERELALYLATAAEPLIEKGELREARKLLQRAVKHDPECAPSLMLMGDIAVRSSDLEEAIERWRRVAILSPDLAAEALRKLETTLFDEGRFGEIERVYSDVRTARSGDEAATLGLGAFYKKQGRGEEAIQLLEDFMAVRPDSVRASLLLTSFYAKFRDSETLEQFLDQSLKESTRSERYHCKLCGFQSDLMRWNCPRCGRFDCFSTNHEL